MQVGYTFLIRFLSFVLNLTAACLVAECGRRDQGPQISWEQIGHWPPHVLKTDLGTHTHTYTHTYSSSSTQFPVQETTLRTRRAQYVSKNHQTGMMCTWVLPLAESWQWGIVTVMGAVSKINMWRGRELITCFLMGRYWRAVARHFYGNTKDSSNRQLLICEAGGSLACHHCERVFEFDVWAEKAPSNSESIWVWGCRRCYSSLAFMLCQSLETKAWNHSIEGVYSFTWWQWAQSGVIPLEL